MRHFGLILWIIVICTIDGGHSFFMGIKVITVVGLVAYSIWLITDYIITKRKQKKKTTKHK